jgi:hypothetical protein
MKRLHNESGESRGKFRKRTEAEVWAMIEEDTMPVPECGCHIWMGAVTKSGYGTVMINRRRHYMHRLIYQKTKGRIPDGMNVCHACDIPSCINPDHLWLGTFRENHEDKTRKGRARGGVMQGMNHKMAKLTDEKVREIRARYAAREVTQVKLAEEYGVNQPTISAIVLRHMWKHI